MRVGINGPKPGTPYGENASVAALRNNLRKLAQRLNEFDYVFSGHFVTDLENSTIVNMLEACEAVCADPEGACSYRKEIKGTMKYFRYVEGLGTLCYTLNSVGQV